MKGLNKIFLPISYDITDKTILIIGGGSSAWKKINILRKFTDRFFVIAKDVCDEIKNDHIPYIEKGIESDDLREFQILYSCTNNKSLNENILEWGHRYGIMVNIHDDPELCDFVSPAIFKQDNITISVSTNGEDALLAITVRDKIKEMFQSENLYKWQIS